MALIQRGTCRFLQRAYYAQEAGAVAAIVFNEGQEGRTDVVEGDLRGRPDIAIAVAGASYELGRKLYEAQGARVSLDVTLTYARAETLFASPSSLETQSFSDCQFMEPEARL